MTPFELVCLLVAFVLILVPLGVLGDSTDRRDARNRNHVRRVR